ncbi:MAG: zinc-binding dehydrogenase [Acidobacteria bacterium]|nr:zinc-binding dehydrogenase [Acidobacteriota bacterium]
MDRQLRAVLMSPFGSQRLTTFISKENYEDMEALSELIESGDVVPAVGRHYSLANTADALRDLAAGSTCGKLVIEV